MEGGPVLSRRQREVLQHGFQRVYRLCIAGGATRGGKTFSCAMAFATWVCAVTALYPDAQFMIAAFSLEAVRRNVLPVVFAALESHGVRARLVWEASQESVAVGEGRARIYMFGLGALQQQSVERIRGSGFWGGMIDEVTQISLEAWQMCSSRFDRSESKYWCTYNAGDPAAWFRTEVIRDLDRWGARLVEFELKDNPSMPAEVRAVFERQFVGAFGRRMLAGEWAPMQGLVYPFVHDVKDVGVHDFDNVLVAGEEPARVFDRVYALDYALSSVMAVIGARAANVGIEELSGATYTTWVLDREYYYDAEREGRTRTAKDHLDRIEAMVPRGSILIIDPSTPTEFQMALQERWSVIPGDNADVVQRVGEIGNLFAARRLVIDREACPNLADELSGYSWAERSGAGEGVLVAEDKPRKQHDHACDALRYLVNWLQGVQPVRFGSEKSEGDLLSWGGRKRPMKVLGPKLGSERLVDRHWHDAVWRWRHEVGDVASAEDWGGHVEAGQAMIEEWSGA